MGCPWLQPPPPKQRTLPFNSRLRPLAIFVSNFFPVSSSSAFFFKKNSFIVNYSKTFVNNSKTFINTHIIYITNDKL